MTLKLTGHPLFPPWTDPKTAVVSYILKTDVAACRQSFYFTNPGLTNNERYLWFYTFNPPSGSAEIGRTLAVADLEKTIVVNCPETQFRDASPYIDPLNGDAYWAWDYSIWKRSPEKNAAAQRVNSVPESVHKNRYGKRLATHLTRSSDGKHFLIDAAFGREWVAGLLPVDGSDFILLQSFDRCFNHAQMSPTDPDLALIAQDWWIDVADGSHKNYENRIWLLKRGQPAKPLFDAAYGKNHTHEWWDSSGRYIWYVDFTAGVAKGDIATGKYSLVWPNETGVGPACHAHADTTGNYLVADIGTYPLENWKDGKCRVRFKNLKTGKSANIVSALPAPFGDRFSKYHVHPHPQFCANDRWICYTTTVLGEIDVALVDVRQLIHCTE